MRAAASFPTVRGIGGRSTQGSFGPCGYLSMRSLAIGLLAVSFAMTLSVHAQPEPVSAPSSQAYGPWRASRIGGGGWVQHVVPCLSLPTRYYAYVDMAGVYRSDDAGRTWRSMNAGLPSASLAGYEIRGLIVDPRDADKLLLAVGHHEGPMG